MIILHNTKLESESINKSKQELTKAHNMKMIVGKEDSWIRLPHTFRCEARQRFLRGKQDQRHRRGETWSLSVVTYWYESQESDVKVCWNKTIKMESFLNYLEWTHPGESNHSCVFEIIKVFQCKFFFLSINTQNTGIPKTESQNKRTNNCTIEKLTLLLPQMTRI